MKLKEIAELAHKQLQPTSVSGSVISLAEFERTAKAEYSYQSLLLAWKQKKDEGYFEVPSYLLTEKELDVVNDEIDISSLEYFTSLPMEVWLQDIGGVRCSCKYVKSTLNNTKLLCDDDSLDDDTRTYYVQGNKIKFPKGAHAKKLPIIYANKGEGVNGGIEIDDAIGALIRQRLVEIYGGKIAPKDETNNENPNN